MRKNSLVALTLGLVFITAGCVSTSKYRALEDEKQILSQSNQGLNEQLLELEAEAARLAESKAALEKKQESMQRGYNQLVTQLQGEVNEGDLKIRQYKNMLKVDVANQLFFKSGSSNLKTSGQEVLKKVAEAINKNPDKMVRIVGHTDSIPVGKNYQELYPTNWELSAIRATNVVRFLQNEGKVAPERMAAIGQGEFQPVDTNDTKEGRAKNRRIEIMLLDKQIFEEVSTQN